MKFEELRKEESGSIFESQFRNVKSFDFLGGKVEYVDIIPENLKNEVPVIFALGWGETIKTFEHTIREMFNLGRRVLCINHPRFGNKNPQGNKDYPKEELRKSLTIVKVLEITNLHKVDVIAHSEGGINTAIAASIFPNKFRKILFVNPGGLIGDDNFFNLAYRFSINLIKEALNEEVDFDRVFRITRTLYESGKYIMKNPSRALKESINISKSKIQDIIKDLHGKGVDIFIVGGVEDPVFPIERMQDVIKEDAVNGFISMAGGHNEIFINPEKVIPELDKLLN